MGRKFKKKKARARQSARSEAAHSAAVDGVETGGQGSVDVETPRLADLLAVFSAGTASDAELRELLARLSAGGAAAGDILAVGERVQNLDPQCARACIGAHLARGDYRETERYARYLVEAFPHEAEGWIHLATAVAGTWYISSRSREREPEIAALVDRAIECDDAWPSLYVIRAKQERSIDGTAANAILASGIARFPSASEPRLELAHRLLPDSPVDAYDLIAPLLDVLPLLPEAHAVAIRALEERDSEGALAILDGLSRTYEWERWPLVRGRILLASGRMTEALACFESLTDSGTREIASDAWMACAAVHAEQTAPKEALACIARATLALFDEFGYACDNELHSSDPAWAGSLDHFDHKPTFWAVRSSFARMLDSEGPDLDLVMLAWEMHAASSLDRDPLEVLASAWGRLGEDRILARLADRAEMDGDYPWALRAYLRYCAFLITNGAPAPLLDSCTERMLDVWRWAAAGSGGSEAEVGRALHDVVAGFLGDPGPHGVPELLKRALATLYLDNWRAYLVDNDPAFGLRLLEEYRLPLNERTFLFDRGFYHLKCDTEPATAAACYRRLCEMEPDADAAWHNLAVALEALGDTAGAIEAYERAAAASKGEGAAHCLAAAKRLSGSARSGRKRAGPDQGGRSERLYRDKLALAAQHFPTLRFYERQLLLVLHAIQRFDSFQDLAELAGQDARYVPGHYRRLVSLGMVVETEDGHEINPELHELIRRELSHSVAARIVRSSDETAVKPIFNSTNEYRVYSTLTEVFPNHLVFPNMALQSIFSYEKMKELLQGESGDAFGYFLRASVDFCIVSSTSYMPLLALEVDSYWHDSPEQTRRDLLKDRMFELGGGGLALIRLRPYGRPSAAALKHDVARAISEWTASRAVPSDGLGFDVSGELDLSTVRLLAPQDA
jgi:tetratricopeptide (TPR) repeat protein